MSSDAPESAHQASSEFLYSAILSVWEQMIACETECRAVDRKRAETEVSNCVLLIVAIYL